MWIGFVAGWIVASVALYGYLVATAKEPRHGECMDCRLTDCEKCPHFATRAETEEPIKRAA